LFLESGFRAISTRQIAQECGLKQPTLYYHFKDKEQIYVALCQAILLRIKQKVQWAIQATNLTIEEKFVEVVYSIMNSFQANYYIMFHDLNHEISPTSQQKIAEIFYQSLLQPVIQLHEEGVRTGYLNDLSQIGVPPIMASNFLLSLIEGYKEPFEEEKESRPKISEREVARLLTRVHLFGFAKVRDNFQS
jgi:AcrR family transcriptional regulator